MIKVILVDFILFSLIEAYVFYLFFKIVGKCNRFKMIDVIIIGLVNSIITSVFPPLMFQLTSIIYLGIMISNKEKTNIWKSLFISISSLTYLMVLEIIYSLAMSIFFNIDTFEYNNLELFLLIIPIRVVEIYLLRRGEPIMKNLKMWIGEVEKPEKEEVKTETK